MPKKLFILLLISISLVSFSQKESIDKVIGVVGKYPILLSDLQNAMLMQEKNEEKISKCAAFEQVLFQKLLVAQADRDSITVTDAEIENELNKRLNYYINQFGSEEKLKKAKMTGLYSLIGLILLLISFGIVDIFINFIYTISGNP